MKSDLQKAWEENRVKFQESFQESKPPPPLSGEWLATLAETAKCYHEGDHVEIRAFVEWCFEHYGRNSPDLSEYDD